MRHHHVLLLASVVLACICSGCGTDSTPSSDSVSMGSGSPSSSNWTSDASMPSASEDSSDSGFPFGNQDSSDSGFPFGNQNSSDGSMPFASEDSSDGGFPFGNDSGEMAQGFPQGPPPLLAMDGTATCDDDEEECFIVVAPAPPTQEASDEEEPPLGGELRIGDTVYLLTDVELEFVEVEDGEEDEEDEDGNPVPSERPSHLSATLALKPDDMPEPGEDEELPELETVGTLTVDIELVEQDDDTDSPEFSGTAELDDGETWELSGTMEPPPTPEDGDTFPEGEITMVDDEEAESVTDDF